MRLYRGQVPAIAEEMTKSLMESGDIEVEPANVGEVQLDIEAVLNEYRRVDYEILEQAKDAVAQRGLDYSHTNKIRQRLAEKRGFGVGDKAYDWILSQLIEALLHSRNVEEIFGEDNALRKQMKDVLRRYTDVDRDMDRQVRARIKNLEEGDQNWEIEYQKVMGDLRQRRGLGE
ncbi:MAG: hypothetical protein ACI9OJ_000505 [Myxococcota bacterium]|jgi:hypothetical protein